MVRIFALGAEFLAALYTEEGAITALRLFTNVAVAEMIPLGKVVAFSAPNLSNLGHFAVCALLLGASTSLLGASIRHTSTYLSKVRTMLFAKASIHTKDLGKLLYRHEASNGRSVQKSEHRVAYEILRKHLGEKHRWRRTFFLQLVPATFIARLDHGDDGS
jgi:hypothetical protein